MPSASGVCVAAGASPLAALVPRPWFILHCSVDGRHHSLLRPAWSHRGSRVRPVRIMDDAAVKPGGRSAPPRARGGASHGWLAVIDDGGRLLLRDAISRDEVPLPAFDPAYRLFDVFLSDDPLAAPGRWTAFAFFRRIDYTWGHALAFCRPGDAEWARFDPDDGQQIRHYRGLEFFRGRAFVLLGNSMRIAVCDVDARRLVVSPVMVNHLAGYDAHLTQQCLVECGGELLFVQVARSFVATRPSCCGLGRRRSYDERFAARVIRIVLDADDSGAPVATSDAEGIGEHALFLAPLGHAFVLPASGFPAVRAGCIYHFTTDMATGNASHMVITDLHERPHRHEVVEKLPLAGQWHPLSWFCPRRLVLDTASNRG